MRNFFTRDEVAIKLGTEVRVIKESKYFPYHAQGFVTGYQRLIKDGEFGLKVTVNGKRGRKHTQVFLQHRYKTELKEINLKPSKDEPEKDPPKNRQIEPPTARRNPTQKERDHLTKLIEEYHLWPY
ncbi:hypothetical protein A2Z53_02805 [Candidatus Giovannonibacteria bacterium RIFCSPHIGHO2_02_42_15]|uniref:Uncharacterized protein n=2 Tax=Candidatus Giovannoniibacteriota TaxID=1752738 RepID=A0A1F5VMM0_9BACT|nr:MAG: hypothetical protein UV11_C0001G0058 [Candidatus Giovannonibacteria bacterium GW2011_GWF2_42_19]OGF64645.1 MAG: hypothetical protein A2Z53_02805 [Candidatus Giovannonibacteria bacterium RIFCSPHIGHO2_02_42_15]